MRILSLDPGSRRFGIALSDELGFLASPLEAQSAEPWDALVQRLRQVIADSKAGLVLVGMPRNMDGTYGPAAGQVREMMAKLAPLLGVPLKPWDERLTTVQAGKYLREAGVKGKQQRAKVDSSAAAVLLQSYLDSIQAQRA